MQDTLHARALTQRQSQATGLVPHRAGALPLRDSAGINRTSLNSNAPVFRELPTVRPRPDGTGGKEGRTAWTVGGRGTNGLAPAVLAKD